MDDAALLKISFFVSTVGLVMLFFLSSQLQPMSIKISEIDYDDVGRRIAIEGKIISVKNHPEGHIFLKVEDSTGKISVVLFSNLAEKIGWLKECLKEDTKIQISGRVEEYRSSLEIVPSRAEDVKVKC